MEVKGFSTRVTSWSVTTSNAWCSGDSIDAHTEAVAPDGKWSRAVVVMSTAPRWAKARTWSGSPSSQRATSMQ